MKKILLTLVGAMAMCGVMQAENLVILHTNDTHSAIYPDAKGQGGIMQRKVIIDSIRAAEPNVILVDAGDIVQGSLFFKFFKGEVEYPLMDMLGYDIRILGNHEFDNGLEDMARYYKKAKSTNLSANYDFKGTAAEGVFDPYVIKKIGGKKIGFLGLNIDPAGMISKPNYAGLKFLPVIETANKTAAYLKKKEHCDLVVAVTHIGYDDSDKTGKTVDLDLAAASKDIDIIIGGHTHTTIDPSKGNIPYLIKNAAGKDVLVTQTGKYGRNLGYINIDLDKIKKKGASAFDYRLIPVTDRFSADRLDSEIMEFLKPYAHAVDSVNNRVIGKSAYYLRSDNNVGGYPNFAGDFVRNYGQSVADSLLGGRRVDLGIMNVGGIRQDMPDGDITEGEILSTFPFSNNVVLLELKGSDLLEALQASASKGGEAVSNEVRVVTDKDHNVKSVLIDMKPLDPERTYLVATIDYLADGNDGLETLAHGRRVWTDNTAIDLPMLRYIGVFNAAGLPVAPDQNPRFVIAE